MTNCAKLTKKNNNSLEFLCTFHNMSAAALASLFRRTTSKAIIILSYIITLLLLIYNIGKMLKNAFLDLCALKYKSPYE